MITVVVGSIILVSNIGTGSISEFKAQYSYHVCIHT